MACFVVPTAEAIVTTVVTKVVEKKGKNVEHGIEKVELENKLSSLRRLNKLLLGGSALLAFEHVWHGEVTPFFPFLTAASNPTDLSEMLVEMGTVGVGMAVLVTAVWATSNIVLKSVSKKVVEE
ncbi:MAG: hypothetical protein MJ112_06250 [Lachnospiraceae bacterium]|nr:hypothetical protein [Lachnospiraceae bacterium]